MGRDRSRVPQLYSTEAPAYAPEWFKKAIQEPREEGFVFDGIADIEYLRWKPDKNAADAQGIVFVHGAGASAWWWAYIAPFFANEGYDCVALSNSGCGRSGFKEAYGARVYSEEILCVTRALGLFSRSKKPFLVSHSFGSVVSLLSCLTFGNLFQGVVLNDVKMEDASIEQATKSRQAAQAARESDKKFAQRDEWVIHEAQPPPVAKFKLAPLQPCNCDFILEFIANTSSVRVGENGEWSWAGDSDRFRKLQLFTDTPYMLISEVRQALKKAPLAFMYGEDSFFFAAPQVKACVKDNPTLRSLAPVVIIPNARHHLMLDEPLAFTSALSALLQTWGSPRKIKQRKAKSKL